MDECIKFKAYVTHIIGDNQHRCALSKEAHLHAKECGSCRIWIDAQIEILQMIRNGAKGKVYPP